MNEYSVGYVPGIHTHVVDSQILNTSELFKDETAGLSEHPSELFAMHKSNIVSDNGTCTNTDNETVHVLIESTGVSDPEGVTVPGQTLNAADLRNMVNKSFTTPDLSIFQSVEVVPEYNNSKLFPGMYPTLFPYGMGGLGDIRRKVKISLQKHVNYLFDIHDRSFRYHNPLLLHVSAKYYILIMSSRGLACHLGAPL